MPGNLRLDFHDYAKDSLLQLGGGCLVPTSVKARLAGWIPEFFEVGKFSVKTFGG